MTQIVGLELEQAVDRFRRETGREPAVEKTAPPRGLPCERGLWRVVRADFSRGCITAAFFPQPVREDRAQEE
ncbi:MAG: hypothetical protein Q4A66_05835 [Eubacteriales bacterium]|nr:hypothetical protein [Eubacteriales bacterium]